jgi:hypothetical protein
MYTVFSSFIFRTPALPFSSLQKILYDEAAYRHILMSKPVQEAIYMASPDLYHELDKHNQNQPFEMKDEQRLKNTLIKYLSRMAARCTPFGSFAGCSTGSIGEKTEITLHENRKNVRYDMSFLYLLSHRISTNEQVRWKIKYYTNNSIYALYTKYRYIEIIETPAGRTHRIASVDKSVYLELILSMATDGAFLHDLVNALTERGIEKDMASAYVLEIVESRLLLSELELTVIGEDYFQKIVNTIEGIDNENEEIVQLKNAIGFLNNVDLTHTVLPIAHRQIVEILEPVGLKNAGKNMFQLDLHKDSESVISRDVIREIQSTLSFLNRIIPSMENQDIIDFKNAFTARYEEREIPLSLALDTETGLGYPVNRQSSDTSPFLFGFQLPPKESQGRTANVNEKQTVLLNKLVECLSGDRKEIVLKEDDFAYKPENWDDLPSTIAVFFQLLESEPHPLISIKSIGGISGANLLARFSHLDPEIEQLIKEITRKEQELEQDAVLAEISYLSDARMGNISARPNIREHEIVYLSLSKIAKENQIPVSDLMLSVRNGQLLLRSKSLNRSIIPRLTTAHNFRSTKIPVYRFLCDMQHQSGRTGLFFNWGSLSDSFEYLPRVRYRNTILSPARWTIKMEEIKRLIAIKEERQLLTAIKDWRTQKKLPQFVLLADVDNQLFVDWENITSIFAFFSAIKNRKTIELSEFLFADRTKVVKDKAGNEYTNEFIVPFYKDTISTS